MTSLTALTEAAVALGVKHKANRAGDLVIYSPEYGTEGADHGRGAEISQISENDFTVIAHEDDGDYRNLGSFPTAISALQAALTFVRSQ
jgi:hypothetical protein